MYEALSGTVLAVLLTVPGFGTPVEKQEYGSCTMHAIVECQNVKNGTEYSANELWNEYCPGCQMGHIARVAIRLKKQGVANAYKTRKPIFPFAIDYNRATHDNRIFAEPGGKYWNGHVACVVGETVINGKQYRVARDTLTGHGVLDHYFINKKVRVSAYYNIR